MKEINSLFPDRIKCLTPHHIKWTVLNEGMKNNYPSYVGTRTLAL